MGAVIRLMVVASSLPRLINKGLLTMRFLRLIE